MNIDKMIEENDRIRRAAEFAKELHKDQKYGDKPYWYHLHGVASNVLDIAPFILRHELGDYESMLEDAIVVAFLHDSVEDGKITVGELSERFVRVAGFPEHVCSMRATSAIDSLTRREDETYHQYIINRVARHGNIVAKLVKIADLRFNMAENLKAMEAGKKHFKHMYDKYSLSEFIVMQSIYGI